MILDNINILIYDIETLHLSSDHFQLGKQFVGHKSLQPNRDQYDIITIQYMWLKDDKVSNLSWIGKETSSKKMIEDFDKIISKADIVIGKNSDRFDSKHINTQRLIHGLEPMPEWGKTHTRDDLEKQIRKHFFLPSYSLDYLCKMLFESGKDSMQFGDWQKIRNLKEILFFERQGLSLKSLNIVSKFLYAGTCKQTKDIGKKALDKMIHYGNKDVMDTKLAWLKVWKYVEPKVNMSRFLGHATGEYIKCRWCGSKRITKDGVDNRQAVPKQIYSCKECKRHSRMTITKTESIGKMD